MKVEQHQRKHFNKCLFRLCQRGFTLVAQGVSAFNYMSLERPFKSGLYQGSFIYLLIFHFSLVEVLELH